MVKVNGKIARDALIEDFKHRLKEHAMSENRLSKPLVFFLALLISMFALGSSSALAEEASIKSLVESGDVYSDTQEESSQAALASENSDKEAPADYNTVTTEDGSVLKWKKDGTKNAKIVGLRVANLKSDRPLFN